MPKILLISLISAILSLVSCSNSGTESFSLSGNVITGGTNLADVTLYISHPRYGTFTVKTDSNGNFSLSDLWNGDYVVTPKKEGYLFEPANATISINGNTSSNFNAISTWQKIILGSGSARASNIKPTSDGGYIIAGYIDTASTTGKAYDFWIIKLDVSGSIVWEKKFDGGSSLHDFAFYVEESFTLGVSDGYVIAGKSETIDRSYDGRVIKIDPSGNIIWNYTYGGADYDELNKIIQSADGGYVLVGKTKSCLECGGFSNVWILKLNSNLTENQNITFGGDDTTNGLFYDDYAFDICKTLSGGYAVIGGTKSYSEADKIIKGLYLKYDSTFNIPDVIVGDSGYYEEEYKSISQTSDGGFIVTGYAKNSDFASYDLILTKTNSSGTVTWRQIIDASINKNDKGFSVVQTSDGGYAVAGESFNSSTDNDIVLFKFDTNGNLLWKKIYSNLLNDSGVSLRETSDQGFIIAGNSESAINHDVLWILKTDRNGIIYGYNDNE